MNQLIKLTPPSKLPRFHQTFLSRIQIIDTLTRVDYLVQSSKIHTHTIMLIDTGNIIDMYMIGTPESGLTPFFDVVMEMAYDFESGNMNIVIINKGDNPVEVKVDGKTIGTMEAISQTMVHWHDEPAYVAKKWISFNFRAN